MGINTYRVLPLEGIPWDPNGAGLARDAPKAGPLGRRALGCSGGPESGAEFCEGGRSEGAWRALGSPSL